MLMKKETYGDMVDLSISQTMVRSINTTVALLLPLLAILIFGGPTLKDFAFALTIGVVTGTYSSFFVAAPLVVIWKEREPRYRKRLVAAGADGATVVDVGAGCQMTGAAALELATRRPDATPQRRAARPASRAQAEGFAEAQEREDLQSDRQQRSPSGHLAERRTPWTERVWPRTSSGESVGLHQPESSAI